MYLYEPPVYINVYVNYCKVRNFHRTNKSGGRGEVKRIHRSGLEKIQNQNIGRQVKSNRA